MTEREESKRGWLRPISRVAAAMAALTLLPPFIALAVAPMVLFMVPVAIVGIPFMIPAFFSGSLATQQELRRTSFRPRALVPQQT